MRVIEPAHKQSVAGLNIIHGMVVREGNKNECDGSTNLCLDPRAPTTASSIKKGLLITDILEQSGAFMKSSARLRAPIIYIQQQSHGESR